jgi:hypothetical protein
MNEWGDIILALIALVLLIGLPFFQDMFPILKYLLPVLSVILTIIVILSWIQLGAF